ncbi:hypothetical protein ACG04R_15890 [Roseateles sp. BYS78W]|uniref:Uncharacterized protein n=1 Tax=Pelomonas candidula TaxID=3299025 RepID=A0ABW7HFA5_9BURK
MKRLAFFIGLFGALNAFLWAWAPSIARWQTRNVLERYGSLESLEIAMQVYQESMRFVFIEAGVVGAAMLLAAALIFQHRVLGWRLWLVCLAICVGSALVHAAVDGLSFAAACRLLVLSAFASSVIKVGRSGAWAAWFPNR